VPGSRCSPNGPHRHRLVRAVPVRGAGG